MDEAQLLGQCNCLVRLSLCSYQRLVNLIARELKPGAHSVEHGDSPVHPRQLGSHNVLMTQMCIMYFDKVVASDRVLTCRRFETGCGKSR
jgi:hypothetical protein